MPDTAILATVADVLASIETDAPDSVIQRKLDAAEADVRAYLSEAQGKTVPTDLLAEPYSIVPGDSDQTIMFASSIRTYRTLRLEGSIPSGGEAKTWTLDTGALRTDGAGTARIEPAPDGQAIPAGAFVITVDSSGKTLTIDATSTQVAVVITRLLGLSSSYSPQYIVDAVLDLVRLSLEYDLVQSERVDQYSEVKRDYDDERYKVLRRLLFRGGESIVA